MIFPMLAIAFMMGTQSCKKDEEMDPVDMPPVAMRSASFEYEFNNGQVVPSAAYDGMHPDNLTAKIMVEETGANMVDITVTLMNTLEGQMYHMHAHDAADPSTTPNGTPYNEVPNDDVFAQMITGNGGTMMVTQEVAMSYDDIVVGYDGFFVVHDPLQNLSTVDISTYLVVGAFAREQAASGLSRSSFSYDFNAGQLVPEFAYAGTHQNNLNGELTIQELGNGMSRVSVMLNNTMNGEMYHTHAHDMADPATTPNGTPYNEVPNDDVLAFMIMGNGSTAFNSQVSPSSFDMLTTNYDAFLVVHDPLQALSTVDPTTYVLLGVFAQN